MSNARMTFRFGDQESDKLEKQGMTASSTLVTMNENLPNTVQSLPKPEPDTNNTSGSSMAVEDMPMDWGGTILADASRSPHTNYASDRNMQDDKYEFDSERSQDLDQGHNWMVESENYSYKRNRPPRGWKMIGSVSGALVTGALFGMVILSL